MNKNRKSAKEGLDQEAAELAELENELENQVNTDPMVTDEDLDESSDVADDYEEVAEEAGKMPELPEVGKKDKPVKPNAKAKTRTRFEFIKKAVGQSTLIMVYLDGVEMPYRGVRLHPGIKAEKMLKYMETQDAVQVMLPLGIKERRSNKTVLEVAINGIAFALPKGRYLQVPKNLADNIMYAMNQTAEVGTEYLADREEQKEGVSMMAALS